MKQLLKKYNSLSYIAFFLNVIPYLFGFLIFQFFNVYLLSVIMIFVFTGFILSIVGVIKIKENKELIYISLVLSLINLFVSGAFLIIVLFIFLIHMS
ncbi:hypothetical protein ACQKCU_19115 [Heyndrickxia sporothermodurans]